MSYPSYPGYGAGYDQTTYASSSSSYPYPAPSAGPSYDPELAQQSSIYTPEAALRGNYKAARSQQEGNKDGKDGPKGGRTTVLRKAGGGVWEDQTLLEWDPAHFRLFIGDLDPALSDDVFKSAFSGPRFPSFVKSKIIRDKSTNKGKGFGFVSYEDPEDFLKAWKEMNGKYVGTRPVSIKKATTGVSGVSIGSKKAHTLEASKKGAKLHGTKPYERRQAQAAAGGMAGAGGSGGYGPQKDRKSYIRR